MVTVSVIVPVYRKELYLEECLASVARQTFQDWECIVVNDGSDNPAFIEQVTYATLGHKGMVVHQQNRGVSAARNAGMQAAHGQFILCLDPDDYVHPEFLARTVPVLQTSSFDIVSVGTLYVGVQQGQLQTRDVHLFWLLQRNLMTVSSLFKREIVTCIGGFDEAMTLGYEDWEFWIRAARAGFRFHKISEPLLYYRITPEGRDARARKQRVCAIRYIRHKHASIYFMPLRSLLSFPQFNGIPRRAIFRFWVTGLFFHYLPPSLQNLFFGLYQVLNGE